MRMQPESSDTQAVKAQLSLRALVLSGELERGERIAELSIVEKLGMSRTPIRTALMKLAQEGLLEAIPTGGYRVRSFTEQDISDAIELRGTLEGLLARMAAERGAPQALLQSAQECLQRIDTILEAQALSDAQFGAYVEHNALFHSLIKSMAGSALIEKELDRIANLPFASPSSFVLAQSTSAQARNMLVVAQTHHREVLDAITRREGARAQALMQEHSRLAQKNLSRHFHFL